MHRPASRANPEFAADATKNAAPANGYLNLPV
jgi:hypothetical protein